MIDQTHNETVQELAGRVHIESQFAKITPSDVNDYAGRWGLFRADTTADKLDLIEVIYELEYQLRLAHQRIRDWIASKDAAAVPSAAKRYVFTWALSRAFECLNNDDWKRRFGVFDTEVRNMAVEVLQHNVAELLGMAGKQLFERRYFCY